MLRTGKFVCYLEITGWSFTLVVPVCPFCPSVSRFGAYIHLCMPSAEMFGSLLYSVFQALLEAGLNLGTWSLPSKTSKVSRKPDSANLQWTPWSLGGGGWGRAERAAPEMWDLVFPSQRSNSALSALEALTARKSFHWSQNCLSGLHSRFCKGWSVCSVSGAAFYYWGIELPSPGLG